MEINPVDVVEIDDQALLAIVVGGELGVRECLLDFFNESVKLVFRDESDCIWGLIRIGPDVVTLLLS